MRGIITLCGSTKFKQQFESMNWFLTSHDFIVLSVGAFHHSTNDDNLKKDIIEHKEQLDKLHKEKIAMSDAIVVIDVGRYYGDSTASEIEYARDVVNIPVYWYSNQSYLNLLDMLHNRS